MMKANFNVATIVILLDIDFKRKTSRMLTSDLDRGILWITYNDIGLTDSICFSNGSTISYVYSMTGEKLWVQKKIMMSTISTGGTSVITPIALYNNVYYGSDVMLNTLSSTATYFFGDGYVDIKITGSSTWPLTQFYYYGKDHLGNIRRVVTKNSKGVISEVQKTHYYPFGGIIVDVSNCHLSGLRRPLTERAQRYDYGACQYDCTVQHFTTPDPLAEKYYDVSPYAYCHNNPVNRVDPDGRDDYYDCFGNFLGSNNNETDYIYIADKFRPLGEWSGQNHYGIISKMPLADAELSAKAWSKILTNTISIMEDVDVKELEGGAVSVLKVSPGNGNTIDGEAFNNPDNSYEYGENASQINNKITAKIGFANENMFATRSNIQNMLCVEEYLEHMKKGLSHFNKDGSANDKKNIKYSMI